MKQTTWHWPDHVIGKRESRRLREEHNELADSHAELVASLERSLKLYDAKLFSPVSDFDSYWHGVRAALAKAKDVGHDS